MGRQREEKEREEELDELEIGDDENECPLCEKTFNDSKAVKLHYKRFHQGKTDFRYEHSSRFSTHSSQCNTQSSYNNVHLSRFSCVWQEKDGTLCKKYFTTRPHMMKHIQEYHKNRTANIIQCEPCNVTFSSKAALTKYNKELHGPGKHIRPGFLPIRPSFRYIRPI